MPYAQIHTQAVRHPKVLALTAPAFRVWVAGHCYCQEHLTDGVIAKVALPALGVRVTPALVAELVAQTLWHDDGDAYRVHDWADWNQTKDQVQAQKAAARRRWHKWADRQVSGTNADGALQPTPPQTPLANALLTDTKRNEAKRSTEERTYAPARRVSSRQALNRAPIGPAEPWCDHDPPCRHQQEHIRRLLDAARAQRETEGTLVAVGQRVTADV